jgi:lipopolysaccharide assembly protein A
MRFVYALLLLIFVGAVAVFAVQNQEPVTLKYLDQGVSCSLAVLVGAVYLLGMVSGWTVVGIVQRSFKRVTEGPRE